MTKTTLIIQDSVFENDGDEQGQIIRQFQPLLIQEHTSEPDDPNHLFFAHFLAVLADGEIRIFNTIYQADNEFEQYYLRSLAPAAAERLDISSLTNARSIVLNTDIQITDLLCEFETPNVREASRFVLYAYDYNSEVKYKYYISNPLFSAISYYDYAIQGCYNANEYSNALNLQLYYKNATIEDSYVKMTLCTSINDVVRLAIEDKKSNSVVAEIRCLCMVRSNENENVWTLEPFTLLMSLILPFKVSSRKTKRYKVEDLTKEYFRDIDQFSYKYSFETNFRNLDKNFLIVYAINKVEEQRMFMLDDTISEKVLEIIEQKYC